MPDNEKTSPEASCQTPCIHKEAIDSLNESMKDLGKEVKKNSDKREDDLKRIYDRLDSKADEEKKLAVNISYIKGKLDEQKMNKSDNLARTGMIIGPIIAWFLAKLKFGA